MYIVHMLTFFGLRSIYPAQLLVNPLFAYIRYIVQYPLVPDFDLESNNNLSEDVLLCNFLQQTVRM